ncbi:AidA/PixA family protein [Xenorhabdus bovienii]|uniref:AidA/PixA family protein n=1 Tax=Xenorhabdus bovienii TaxID=40576 RepID=UPI00237D169F|nr:AidA/PixA family protein [Xenorhabdus bovienii]MDE1482872.1 hypothetical protein [Xenorhabdus bovienii]MDE9426954.1 hypothetical protein [Xenorhabdus bovienii]MDE9431714.1 hypothetical protein [Xenorhabdus bovienii]MDE9464815.1 hypothetical protein [Xenorhabdus bovienii]MDE9489439.1 hypothetical protein [Xenorhabdus bovienii]
MNSNFKLFIALDLDKIISGNHLFNSPESPKISPSNLVHMLYLDEKENKLIDKGGEVLTLENVNRGDSIYWSVITLPNYKSYFTAVLEKYIKVGKETQIISIPDLNVKTVTIPYIRNDDDREVEKSKIKNNYWVSEVRSVGDVHSQEYQGMFSVYNNEGTRLGYSNFTHRLILNSPKQNP